MKLRLGPAYEESLYAVIGQVLVPRAAFTLHHLVGAGQRVLGRLGDVDHPRDTACHQQERSLQNMVAHATVRIRIRLKDGDWGIHSLNFTIIVLVQQKYYKTLQIQKQMIHLLKLKIFAKKYIESFLNAKIYFNKLDRIRPDIYKKSRLRIRKKVLDP
jgi:hypothetical protein